MAKPTTLSYAKMIIYVGDGAAPEVFASPCGLTAKGLDFAAQASDVVVPDCDDPDAPAWIERATRSLSGKITGSGILAVEAFNIWRDWVLSGLPKNCRVQFVGSGLGYYAGSFLLTACSYKGNQGEKVTVDVTLDSDGQITFVSV